MPQDVQDDASLQIPLRQMVTFRISRLHARMSAQATNLLSKTAGITLMQWRVFVMLETHGKITPAEIVRLTDLDKGQLSRAIKSMVKDGLIISQTSESDLRAQVIEFTEKGLEVFHMARPHMRKRQLRLLGALSGEEQEALFSAMGKLDLVMDELEGEE